MSIAASETATTLYVTAMVYDSTGAYKGGRANGDCSTPHIDDSVGYIWYWLKGTTPNTLTDAAMEGFE
ncbi:hypothetical protein V6615_12220 [Oscillospiraceae bacterium PP1C4]